MKKALLSIICSLSVLLISAQTFTNSVGGAITDNNVYTVFPIVVSGLPTAINTTTFGLEYVKINVVHPHDADLRMKLFSPTGSVYILTSFAGGATGANYTNTIFDDTASVTCANGTAPFTGVYKTLDAADVLANFNNGQNPNGTWTLQIRDQTAGNVGSLTNVSLTFSTQPAGGFNFTSSNLPIFSINTNGVTIPDAPRIQATMGIIYNGPGVRNYMSDPFNTYNNKIAIELRGSSSQSFPQKSYGFVTEDTAGVQHDTIMMGMPIEHDWILYAPYDDKTCMRDVLTYDIGNKTGHYCTRTKYCELMLNGQYQGIYVLMEKIKRDHNRVNITKMDSLADNAGDSLTGGYIIKIDKTTGTNNGGWNSNYLSLVSNHSIYFQYDYPGGSISLPQKTYIQSYVDSFETALNGPNFADPNIGYRKYAKENTFIDYFIVNELSKNVDGYRLSSYFHKDRYSKDGRLKAGPLWDFNLAFWNANYCSGDLSTGWAYQFNSVCGSDGYQIPFWWDKFMQDPVYVTELRCRWQQLRQTTLSLTAMNNYIDSTAAYLGEAEVRHFTKWPIIGVYTWPNPNPIPTSYAGEITAMKNWIAARVAWIDANLPGTCTPSVASFYSNDTVMCAGDSVKFHDNSSLSPTAWSWSFPGGSPSTSNLQNPKILYTTAGTYNVTLTVTNPGGTSLPVTFTSYVRINPLPVASVSSNISICVGDSVMSSAFSSSIVGSTYIWTNSDSTIGLASSGAGNYSSFVGLNTGGAPVTSTVSVVPTANGCIGTAANYTISVNPLPAITADSSTICLGATATITASGGTSYTWSAGATATGANTASVTPSTTTTYTVTGTLAGCSGTAISTITVDSVATPSISIVGNILTSSAVVGNQWYLDGVIIPGATNQNDTAIANGNYTVVVTSAGCTSAISNPTPYFSVGIANLVNDNSISIYPNPFSDNFYVSFYLAQATQLSIEVTDVLGRTIKTVDQKEFNQGTTNLEINFTNGELNNGMYFLKVTSASGTVNKKLTKIK